MVVDGPLEEPSVGFREERGKSVDGERWENFRLGGRRKWSLRLRRGRETREHEGVGGWKLRARGCTRVFGWGRTL